MTLTPDQIQDGSPAHAGIVPTPTSATDRPSRFPRTRGDSPAVGECYNDSALVPPHTRG